MKENYGLGEIIRKEKQAVLSFLHAITGTDPFYNLSKYHLNIYNLFIFLYLYFELFPLAYMYFFQIISGKVDLIK